MKSWQPVVHTAITPHLDADDLRLPAFTADDAKAYILAHPTYAFVNMSTATADDITIAFMTSAEGGKLLNNSHLGVAHDAPVCVVQIRGVWREHVPTLIRQRPITPGGPAFVCRSYDARTGNPLVLCWSTKPYLK